jgi:diacylglycerol kinase family enzyme
VPPTLRVVNSVGIGFEGRVNYESHRIRGLRGPAVYLAAVARALAHRQAQQVTIDWDTGAWSGDVLLVSVCIGQRVGGAFRLAPQAHNDDGLFDVCIASKVGLWRILALLPRTFNGTHVRAAGVQMVATTELRLMALGGVPVHVDGEFIGLDLRELQVEMLPRALRVLAPERQ